MSIAWIDLETTGVDENTDKILEVGIVVTNDALVEAGEYNVVINPGELPTMSPIVLDMHTRNGLFGELANGYAPDAAQESIVNFLRGMHDGGRRKQFILAGSGVSHFDSRFIRKQMPDVASLLTFWTYDSGVVRRAFEAAGRKDLLGKPGKPHRALADARMHLEEWRLFQKLIKEIPRVNS